ncbi:MAG: hypothetical protein IPN95_26575, partial [Bacteroidetes bacterium]|nr:hypothetical protein [Bacteroidota bacterium]
MSSASIGVTRWAHIVLTADKANSLLTGYLDGVNFTTSAIDPNTFVGQNQLSIRIGWGHWVSFSVPNNYFLGQLDDIGIWNRALTPCEVRALYLSSTQPYASADTLNNCGSYTWPVTGQTYTQSGIYTDTLQSVQGCDSIVGLDLTILQPSAVTLTESACG